MKARIKFRKYGVLRFIGHLDVMRYFQKVMRRADIPIAFTGGYSPHMIMSFASPLGIGLEKHRLCRGCCRHNCWMATF